MRYSVAATCKLTGELRLKGVTRVIMNHYMHRVIGSADALAIVLLRDLLLNPTISKSHPVRKRLLWLPP